MVAALPISLAVRDIMLAAGLGFLLGLLYRSMRLVLGGGRLACFFCDVSICMIAALLYRSAATGVFAAGVMRWYTAMALLAAYALVQAVFAPFFLRVERGFHAALRWPFAQFYRCVVTPLRAAAKKRKEKRKQKIQKKKEKPTENPGKDLPKTQRVLYNSN